MEGLVASQNHSKGESSTLKNSNLNTQLRKNGVHIWQKRTWDLKLKLREKK